MAFGGETPMATVMEPMRWLEDRIPLTLLIDVLDEHGPGSREICTAERGDASWLPLPRSA